MPDRLDDIEARQRRSAKLRAQFGIDDRSGPVDEFLRGRGAIPTTVGVVMLILFAFVSVIFG